MRDTAPELDLCQARPLHVHAPHKPETVVPAVSCANCGNNCWFAYPSCRVWLQLEAQNRLSYVNPPRVQKKSNRMHRQTALNMRQFAPCACSSVWRVYRRFPLRDLRCTFYTVCSCATGSGVYERLLLFAYGWRKAGCANPENTPLGAHCVPVIGMMPQLLCICNVQPIGFSVSHSNILGPCMPSSMACEKMCLCTQSKIVAVEKFIVFCCDDLRSRDSEVNCSGNGHSSSASAGAWSRETDPLNRR